MSCRFVVRAVVLASLLAAAPAFATRVVHFDTRALVHESSDIVIGEVAGIQAHWNERHTKIVTDVEIRVSQTLKGVPTERLTLRQLGGEVDGMRYHVPGSPVFANGEQALLFVWRDRAGRAQVNGFAQGKFDIRRDPVTGERVVERALPGLAIGNARTLTPLRAGESAPRVPLETMVGEIQRALAEDGR